jgi:hypothetical protein
MLTDAIRNAIVLGNGSLPSPYTCDNPHDVPLNRGIVDKRDAMINHTTFEPIIAKYFQTRDVFEIIDGRHRYVATILNGYSHIPVVISETVVDPPVVVMEDTTEIIVPVIDESRKLARAKRFLDEPDMSLMHAPKHARHF